MVLTRRFLDRMEADYNQALQALLEDPEFMGLWHAIDSAPESEQVWGFNFKLPYDGFWEPILPGNDVGTEDEVEKWLAHGMIEKMLRKIVPLLDGCGKRLEKGQYVECHLRLILDPTWQIDVGICEAYV